MSGAYSAAKKGHKAVEQFVLEYITREQRDIVSSIEDGDRAASVPAPASAWGDGWRRDGVRQRYGETAGIAVWTEAETALTLAAVTAGTSPPGIGETLAEVQRLYRERDWPVMRTALVARQEALRVAVADGSVVALATAARDVELARVAAREAEERTKREREAEDARSRERREAAERAAKERNKAALRALLPVELHERFDRGMLPRSELKTFLRDTFLPVDTLVFQGWSRGGDGGAVVKYNRGECRDEDGVGLTAEQFEGYKTMLAAVAAMPAELDANVSLHAGLTEDDCDDSDPYWVADIEVTVHGVTVWRAWRTA